MTEAESRAGALEPGARSYPPKPSDVYFFATCLVDQFVPQAGLDAVRLLEREGIRVHFPPDQTCCGQPAHSSGYPDEARTVAAQQLALFTQPWPIVVPSGSCAGMMRCHYPHLFARDPVWAERARDVAGRVFELSEFLVHVVGFRPSDHGASCCVALHTSCHARRQMGVHETSKALLESLSGVTVVEHARVEECCGFGGTFSLLHPEISTAMVTDKVQAIAETPAQMLVTADCGCMLNIAGRMQRMAQDGAVRCVPATHLASFLWQRTQPGGAS